MALVRHAHAGVRTSRASRNWWPNRPRGGARPEGEVRPPGRAPCSPSTDRAGSRAWARPGTPRYAWPVVHHAGSGRVPAGRGCYRRARGGRRRRGLVAHGALHATPVGPVVGGTRRPGSYLTFRRRPQPVRHRRIVRTLERATFFMVGRPLPRPGPAGGRARSASATTATPTRSSPSPARRAPPAKVSARRTRAIVGPARESRPPAFAPRMGLGTVPSARGPRPTAIACSAGRWGSCGTRRRDPPASGRRRAAVSCCCSPPTATGSDPEGDRRQTAGPSRDHRGLPSDGIWLRALDALGRE